MGLIKDIINVKKTKAENSKLKKEVQRLIAIVNNQEANQNKLALELKETTKELVNLQLACEAAGCCNVTPCVAKNVKPCNTKGSSKCDVVENLGYFKAGANCAGPCIPYFDPTHFKAETIYIEPGKPYFNNWIFKENGKVVKRYIVVKLGTYP